MNSHDHEAAALQALTDYRKSFDRDQLRIAEVHAQLAQADAMRQIGYVLNRFDKDGKR
ncbi:hypothetical protein ACFQ36_02795 [Arthrobacter sp. GCM10027362]|uniref:hypothetical protein n=1 Tax=Arthrobacter sp. GCM10027362 TaxID=3273379 RepID=UPI003641EFC5